MARPSMWIDLQDPSSLPKLREEFAEHIPGFFGKQRTKAMKKQLDGDMLWRQMLQKKREGDGDGNGGGKNPNKKKKKKREMSADERVEAMLQAGAI